MKKFILLLCLLLAIFILRESSSVNEDEAKEIALGIISESYLNACGGNFNKHLIINKENPLDVSGVWGIDKSGYTFESNNGECTIIIYVYKYWGGYESALDPD